MTLSDEDRRRIEEEEYRKLARERLERTVRIEADIRTSGDQRIEVRGVGTEIYSDAKGAAKGAARGVMKVPGHFANGLAQLSVLLSSDMRPRENSEEADGFFTWAMRCVAMVVGVLFFLFVLVSLAVLAIEQPWGFGAFVVIVGAALWRNWKQSRVPHQ